MLRAADLAETARAVLRNVMPVSTSLSAGAHRYRYEELRAP